jgi:hypothetical protein
MEGVTVAGQADAGLAEGEEIGGILTHSVSFSGKLQRRNLKSIFWQGLPKFGNPRKMIKGPPVSHIFFVFLYKI